MNLKKVLFFFGSIYSKLDGSKGRAIVLPWNGGDWRGHQGVNEMHFCSVSLKECHQTVLEKADAASATSCGRQ